MGVAPPTLVLMRVSSVHAHWTNFKKLDHLLKQCTKCQTFYKHSEYRVQLSRAASEGRGLFDGKRLWMEMSICRQCRPKPRPYTSMTERELNTLVLSNDITREYADQILSTRATNARRKMSNAVKKRWQRERLARVKPALDLCASERNSVKTQLRCATKSGKPDVIAFCEMYLQVISDYANSVRVSQKLHDVPSETKANVFDAWHACGKTRGPMLFSKLADILSASQPESENGE